MISLSELSSKLKKETKVALFCHVRPDGDTLGSALALSLALNNLGVKADVYCDDTVPARFFFLKSAEKVKKEFNGEYSALIAIDSADLNRIGVYSDIFAKHKNTYCIDHHISNPRYAKYNYVLDSASNCENVLALIEQLGANIDEDIANLLAMGILTDTGNFKHRNVNANTLLSTAKLVEKGANLNEISFHMFTKQTKERAKLFGLTMSKIRYFLDDRFAVALVSASDLEQSKAQKDETEGFIDFIMGIDTVKVGACVLEMAKNKYKISFRSKGPDVSAIASAFGGGGHILASGCQIQGEYEEVVDKIRFEVSKYIED